MNTASFTVHLPVYINDRAEYFQQAIDSIYVQTLLPRELVIIEDGPIDGEVRKIIERCREERSIAIKSIRFEQNMGMGVAFAAGVEAASHELIARMDADDIALPHRFERQYDFMLDHPDIDICGGWLTEFTDNVFQLGPSRKLPERQAEIYRFAKKRCPFNHPTVMYRKSAVLRAGNYHHARNLEDYNLWVRMLHQGSQAYNFQETLVYFRVSPNMYSRRGGWKYLMDELQSLYEFYRLGFYSLHDLLMQASIRCVFRRVPNRVRLWMYQKLLRR